MTVVIETIGGGRTEINCEAEEGARIMQAIYDTPKDKKLRLTVCNLKKEIIVNTRHLIKAYSEHP